MEDTSILLNTARLVLSEPDAASNLVSVVKNSASPEAGSSVFVIMMIQSITDMLSQAGIDVSPDTWLAPDGVLDQLLPDIVEILQEAGIQVGPEFAEGLVSSVLERAKGLAQAESNATGVPPSDPAVSTGEDGGLLNQLGSYGQ